MFQVDSLPSYLLFFMFEILPKIEGEKKAVEPLNEAVDMKFSLDQSDSVYNYRKTKIMQSQSFSFRCHPLQPA